MIRHRKVPKNWGRRGPQPSGVRFGADGIHATTGGPAKFPYPFPVRKAHSHGRETAQNSAAPIFFGGGFQPLLGDVHTAACRFKREGLRLLRASQVEKAYFVDVLGSPP